MERGREEVVYEATRITDTSRLRQRENLCLSIYGWGTTVRRLSNSLAFHLGLSAMRADCEPRRC